MPTENIVLKLSKFQCDLVLSALENSQFFWVDDSVQRELYLNIKGQMLCQERSNDEKLQQIPRTDRQSSCD